MESCLITAAQTGNIEILRKFIEDDPLLLHKVSLSGNDTPLHIASMAGHTNFVQEIIKFRKEFAHELNQDGVSPLHIASANGYVDIVRELLKIDRNLCLMRGRERRVPLHYAAIKGRVCVLQALLVSSPDSIEEVTSRGESSLHLAVKNSQFEALVILVDHLKEFNKEAMLNRQDEQGNTVLHLAISRKQYEVVDLLLGQNSKYKATIEVNSSNKNGLTPLDTLFLFQSEAGDREIEDILTQNGATKNNNNTTKTNQQSQTSTEERAKSPTQKLIEYFKFDSARDSPGEVRNTLLVIASLIATATYQAVLQPPGGVWQDDSLSTSKSHTAGKSVMGDKNTVTYGMFLLFNSLGFFASLTMIYTLTTGFPLQLELQFALLALTITYDASMTAISPKGALSTFFTIISIAIPALIPIVTLVVRNYLKRPRNVSTIPRV